MNFSVIYCDNCGAANRPEARFCHGCGQQLSTRISTATGLLTTSQLLKQRYLICEKIGEGGFGAVYKAEDTLFGSMFRAMKELGIQNMTPQEAREAIAAFKQEATLLAGLVHPNLPRIYDYFEDHGRWYLVMDYIQGETLESRLSRTRGEQLPLGDVLKISLQLCDVLDYLHQHQPPIIFRDMKPANVMLIANDHLYLIDFGIARFFKPGQAKDTMSLGTPGYAAPEQYGRMQTTIRSDIYGLGATLHHMLSGQNPGMTPFRFAPLNLTPPQPALTELETLIQSMVEIKEEQRPTDMRTIKQTLLHIQTQLQSQSPIPHSQPSPQPAPTPLKSYPVVSSLDPAGTRLLALDPQLLPLNSPSDPPSSIPTVRSIIVSADGDGQYTSINKALQEAEPGTTIFIQPGHYAESLVITKHVELIGFGPKEQIIIENQDGHCLSLYTDAATLRKLTLRCNSQSKLDNTIEITHGQPVIEDCIISSTSSSTINIHGPKAQPTFRYCTILESPAHGIDVSNDAHGTFEYCEIAHQQQAAIFIASGARPTFRHCQIHDGQQDGITVIQHGQGTFEDCEINNFAGSALHVTTQGNPLLLRCKLHHNQQSCIITTDKGMGSYQNCDISASGADNVVITTQSTPYFYQCKIHEGQKSGVVVSEDGLGTIEYSEIFAHPSANVHISQGGNPQIMHCQIHHSGDVGLTVLKGGHATIENCTFVANRNGPWLIADPGTVTLKGNQILISKES